MYLYGGCCIYNALSSVECNFWFYYISLLPWHRNTSKKYNIMAFNVGDKVNCSTWTQVGFLSPLRSLSFIVEQRVLTYTEDKGYRKKSS